jgi:phosphoenolpyruvate carboxylase
MVPELLFRILYFQDMTDPEKFDQLVRLRYNLYNSLFLKLPFKGITQTGNYLPLLSKVCQEGLAKGVHPDAILEKFFLDHLPDLTTEQRWEFLFRVVQYVERQIVLFDAIEDASFESLNNPHRAGTLNALFNRIANKKEKKRLEERLMKFGVRIVLTAHPTQFYPGNVLSIITDLEQAIRDENFAEANLLVQQLGRTRFYNREKPGPLDEAVSLIWYLENVFYQALPKLFNTIKGYSGLLHIPPGLIKLGFWPGGDRDGNPFVTSDVTLKTAAKTKEAILRCYQRDIRQLKRKLTFPKVDKLARTIEVKITNAIYNLEGARYKTPMELVDDLRLIRSILRSENNGLYLKETDSFMEKVQAFGFHFATLDIRQDSSIHLLVVREILRKNEKLREYNALLKPEDRVSYLIDCNLSAVPEDYDGIIKETLQSFIAIRKIQEQNGPEACNRYIISNTSSVVDIFHVFFLFKATGWDLNHLPVDIVPLFETIEDLKIAGRIMNTFYRTPTGQHHIHKTRGGKQTVMLGFSDGTKDGGYVAANWAIMNAKYAISKKSEKAGVSVLFFDGRGGPPARGGGDTHRFYASMGPEISDNELQLTIQGQTISSKFGSVPAAVFNLEQLLTAGITSHIFESDENPFHQSVESAIDEISIYALKAYEALKHHPQFISYLEKKTVLNFYGETNIGSRPVKRRQEKKLKLSDLRAIPFVGAWAQMKQNVPGFYGLGTALRKFNKKYPGKLQELYESSGFFRTLLDNSMQSLAKTNFELTRYLEHDPVYGPLWSMLHDEFQLSVKMLLETSGAKDILEDAPIIKRSIALREEIVTPLLVIQQAMLQWHEAHPNATPQEVIRCEKLILRCFFGNINSSRNSA